MDGIYKLSFFTFALLKYWAWAGGLLELTDFAALNCPNFFTGTTPATWEAFLPVLV